MGARERWCKDILFIIGYARLGSRASGNETEVTRWSRLRRGVGERKCPSTMRVETKKRIRVDSYLFPRIFLFRLTLSDFQHTTASLVPFASVSIYIINSFFSFALLEMKICLMASCLHLSKDVMFHIFSSFHRSTRNLMGKIAWRWEKGRKWTREFRLNKWSLLGSMQISLARDCWL